MAISFAANMFPKHDEQLSNNVDVCIIWLNSWCLNSLMFHTVSDFQNVHDSISNCCEFTLSLSRNCQDFCHVADHRTIMKGIRICTRCNGWNSGDIYLEMIPNLLPEQSFKKHQNCDVKLILPYILGVNADKSSVWSVIMNLHLAFTKPPECCSPTVCCEKCSAKKLSKGSAATYRSVHMGSWIAL